jgi:outer membrane protein OmpA-like peptidoglycan-associated protein
MNLDPSSERIEGTTITKKIYMELNFIGKLNVDLPLALYFDNDRPDPRTISTKTNRDYSSSFERYYGRKDYFIRRFTTGLSGDEKVQYTDNMNAFFDDDLKGGYDQFQAFLDVLLQVLQNGQELELQVKGYASPVAPSTYNLYLGQRRVGSIRNEMDRYKDGAIKKFIESGQLVVTDISYGETLAPQNVSDEASNKRLSVYSVDASKERRVEIVQVLRLAVDKK